MKLESILILICISLLLVCRGDDSLEISSEDNLDEKEHGEPISILDVTDKNEFIAELEGIKNIFEKPILSNRKVVAVSIVGIFRKGKSFLLNYFLRYLYGNFVSANYPENPLSNKDSWIGDENEELSGFLWRSSIDRVTNGIVMWSDVFLYDTELGDKLAILLIDTQGLFDDKTSPTVNSKIFALTTMISSVQIYNLHNLVQEDQLHYLHFTSDYAKLINRKEAENNDEFGNSTFNKPFQRIVLLMRDWTNFEDYPFGLEGGQKYLNEILQITQEHKQDAMEVRQFIQSSYENISCYLMPHPGDLIFSDDDFNGEWSKLDEKFVDLLKDLISWIFDPSNLTPKRMLNKFVTVEEYVELLKFYFEAASLNEVMNVSTIYDATMDSEGSIILLKSLKIFKQNLRENENFENEMFLKEISKIGNKSQEVTIKEFNKMMENLIENESFIKRWSEKLKDQMTFELNEWKTDVIINYEKFQNVKQKSQQETTRQLEALKRDFENQINELTKKNLDERINLELNFNATINQYEIEREKLKQENDAEREKIINQKIEEAQIARFKCEEMVMQAKKNYNNEMNLVKEREDKLIIQKIKLVQEEKVKEGELKTKLENENKKNEVEVKKLKDEMIKIEDQLKKQAAETERKFKLQQNRDFKKLDLEYEEHKVKQKLKELEHRAEIERIKSG